jgi:hypothetical protein
MSLPGEARASPEIMRSLDLHGASEIRSDQRKYLQKLSNQMSD